MRTSGIRSAYSATKQAWKENSVVRLIGALCLLGLLTLILLIGEGASVAEVVKKTFVVASVLVLLEIDFRESKKNAHKRNTRFKKWLHRVTHIALIGTCIALVASYVWLG